MPGICSPKLDPAALPVKPKPEADDLGLKPEAAADDFLHDFGCAAVNGLDTGIEEGLSDLVFAHVAITAMELHAGV